MTMDRQHWIDKLYEQIKAEVPITRAAYGNSLHGWDIEPIMLGDEAIGVYIRRGHETHMSLSKKNALRHARHVIRVYLTANLERLGYLVTRTDGNAADDRFLKRLGYYETGKEGSWTLYSLDKLNIK